MSQNWTSLIPPSMGGGELVIREVGVAEVERFTEAAMASAGADEKRLVMAGAAAHKSAVQASLVSWKGQIIEDGNPRLAFFSKLRPKEKALIDRMYRKVHSLSEDEESYFLESIAPVGNESGVSA